MIADDERDAQAISTTYRDSEEATGPEGAEGRVEQLGQPALGEHEGQAAATDKQGECRDDRLDPEICDIRMPLATPTAAPRRGRSTMATTRPVAEVERQQRRSDRHDGADRQVDPLVPMTSAIPRAMIATGTTWTNCSRMLSISAKRGVNTQVEDHQQEQTDVDATLRDPSRGPVAVDRPAGRRQLSRRHGRRRRPADPPCDPSSPPRAAAAISAMTPS